MSQEIILKPLQTINDYCTQKRIYKAALARKMNMKYDTLIKSLKSGHISVEKLEAICHGLEHNFFADLARQLPSLYTCNITHDKFLENRIAELENNLRLVTAERDILLKAVTMG